MSLIMTQYRRRYARYSIISKTLLTQITPPLFKIYTCDLLTLSGSFCEGISENLHIHLSGKRAYFNREAEYWYKYGGLKDMIFSN